MSWSLAIQGLGLVCLTIGVGMYSIPAGVITAGILAILAGVALERTGR